MTNKNSERVARSQKKAMANGAMRVNVVLNPPAVEALRALDKARYAPSNTAIINRALLEAQLRIKPQ